MNTCYITYFFLPCFQEFNKIFQIYSGEKSIYLLVVIDVCYLNEYLTGHFSFNTNIRFNSVFFDNVSFQNCYHIGTMDD